MLAAISHIDYVEIESMDACELFASTLADVAEIISNEDMQRFLIIGAHLYKRGQDEIDSRLQLEQEVQAKLLPMGDGA
ncbi:MAG TPA: hypothetical protein VFF81_03100 [Noviherbaspirillum sp.]|nr:hypothetical protein [Noviherbaspirillum sp.]